MAQACDVELPPRVVQGSLVVAHARGDCKLRFGSHALSIAPDGSFVFGVGRDAPPKAELEVGAKRLMFEIEPREFPTENVTGVPQATVTPPPGIAERIAREQAQVAAARRRDDAREDYAVAFTWPVRGRISGHWGSQRILNGTPKDPHPGFDIAAPSGTPVKAPAPGVVTFAAPDLYLTGGTVLIDHGHGVSSVFIHLSRVDVEVGDALKQGDVFGAVGMTGRASGPHLHWGMNWFETKVDPELLLPRP
jgi:murein DD-endopeptidase MepM/ murein hydrolase activator NlpD